MFIYGVLFLRRSTDKQCVSFTANECRSSQSISLTEQWVKTKSFSYLIHVDVAQADVYKHGLLVHHKTYPSIQLNLTPCQVTLDCSKRTDVPQVKSLVFYISVLL